MKNRANTFILITAIMLGQATLAHGASSIVDSKHNLSASGPGTIKAVSGGESEVCIFCHTPHSGRSDITYLWNRSAQTTTYIPYASTTMSVKVGQPNRASKLCLSCHDGTIALGATLTRTIPFSGADTLSGRSTSLGTDLGDDHPVSFYYAESTEINDELVDIAPGSPVKLDSTGQLQCTACHDPHNDFNGKFLVMANDHSALCATCHDKTGWPESPHATSNATIGTTTVARNACGNCHQPHNAGSSQRLLKHSKEEDNCLGCHNGSVASKNIAGELTNKKYTHPVSSSSGIHEPAEKYSGLVTKHVECVDCHNPHQAKKTTTEVAPYVPGPLKGVRGVDLLTNADVNPAIYEYQICFKCHGDSKNNMLTSPPPIPRHLDYLYANPRDNREKFNNVSYHPVINPLDKIGDNLLNSPWKRGSYLYCTDCHGNDSANPKGPHGSNTPHILIAKYETSDVPSTSPTAYLTDNALCFRCHNSATLIGGATKFPQHKVHLTTGTMERCSYCHDPHGSPHAGMINFDTRVVKERNNQPIQLKYPLAGKNTCYLTCHGIEHGGNN